MGVTDQNGCITLSDVEEGWYEVTEVTPAKGYLPLEQVYEVYAESGKPGTVAIQNHRAPTLRLSNETVRPVLHYPVQCLP